MSVSRLDDAAWERFGGEFYRAFRECAEAGLQAVETVPSMRMKVKQYNGEIRLGTVPIKLRDTNGNLVSAEVDVCIRFDGGRAYDNA